MKLIIKNLKQITYNVEIASEKSTVADLKKEIEKAHGFDAAQLKLLHNGVVLEDSKTLEEYKIQEENVIIMMNSKVKPKNVGSSSEANTNTSAQPQKEEKTEEKKPQELKPPEKNNKNEEKYTQQLNSLIDMGFERTQAEAAIKAARGQIDMAIDYLYNGYPEGINDVDMQGGDVDNEDNGGNEGGDDDDDEDPLKKVASIAKIFCQNNPQALSGLLQNIQQNDPDLMNLINENEDQFKAYLEQPVNEQDYRAFQKFQQEMGLGSGPEEGHHHGGGIRINLTPEEEQAIKRLKDLGNFSEADVLQAYFACDKNEELTANYLFEQKMRDDDEMFGGKNNNNNNNNNNGQNGP